MNRMMWTLSYALGDICAYVMTLITGDKYEAR